MNDKNESRIFCERSDGRRVFALHPKAVGQSFDTPELGPAEVREDGIAIVSVCGPLEHHRSWMFDSYDDILSRVEAALRLDETRALVMCFDSPGGDAAGATEAHRKIRRLRKKYGKPVYSYANESAYSAAYELACAADELWLPDTGGVGSVGVIAMVMSQDRANTKAGIDIRLITSGSEKADSHPDRPLTDEIVGRMQERVDYLAEVFFGVVAESRGMTVQAVKDLEAGVFHGSIALEKGLADGVAGWDKFLSLIGRAISSAPGSDADQSAMQARGRVSVKSGRSGSRYEAKMASKKLLSLMTARDEAMAAVASASSDAERKQLLAKFEAAASELALFKSQSSKSEEEDMKHKSKSKSAKSEDEEPSEEDGPDEEDCEEDAEDEEPKEDAEDDPEGTDGSTDGEEDAEEAKAFYSAKTGLYTPQRLVRLCQQVTGKKGIREMFGSLDAMGIRVKSAVKTEKRLARLEGENRKNRVEKMLAQAKRDGKITRAQVDNLRAKGMADPKFLKGFLADLPKIIRTVDDGPAMPRMDSSGNLVGMPTTSDQEKIMSAAFAGLHGEALEKAKADFGARLSNQNGAGKRY